MRELIAARTASEVETAISSVSASSAGSMQEKTSFLRRLEEIQDDAALNSGSKLRRKTKRLITILTEMVTTQNNDDINKDEPIENAVNEEDCNIKGIKSISQSLRELIAVRTASEVESAIASVSASSAGSMQEKTSFLRRLEEIQDDAALNSGSKLRRKTKRLITILTEMITTQSQDSGNRVVSQDKDINADGKLSDVPSMSAKEMDSVTANLLKCYDNGYLWDIERQEECSVLALQLSRIQGQHGSGKSRRTLRRLIGRIISPPPALENSSPHVDRDIKHHVIRAELQRLSKVLERSSTVTTASVCQQPLTNIAINNSSPHTNDKKVHKNNDTVETTQPSPVHRPESKSGGTSGSVIPYVAFIGQLSFDTTVEDIQTHLVEAGITCDEGGVPPVVRLLTDPSTGSSRGAAFVEFSSAEQLYKCIALHHSMLNGRRINVEKSCGGRNKEHRAMKIRQFKEEQQARVSQAIDRILREHQEKGLIKENEVSFELRNRLYLLPVNNVSRIFSRLCGPGCEHIEISQLEKKVMQSERKRARDRSNNETIAMQNDENVENIGIHHVNQSTNMIVDEVDIDCNSNREHDAIINTSKRIRLN